MSRGIRAPRGTSDVLGDAALARERVEEVAGRILERSGYRRIETPTFEATELFARGVGEATDVVQKEMYTFSAGEESLTLRPEGTAPVCRAYMEHGMHKEPQPVKLWYASRFYRHERPQAGRYREFAQIGAEAIGSAEPSVDAELIVLLAEILETLGVPDTTLVLATLGTPTARAEYREELAAYLRAHEDQLSEDVRARIDLNPLRAFDAKHPGTQQVMAGAPRLLDRLPADDLEHFATVQELLGEAGLEFTVDTTLVRGLDYYTRTLFEFQSGSLEAAQNTLGGGGRYDGLVEQLGGPATPGMGWAAGVERMLMAAPAQPVAPAPVDLYVAYAGDAREHRTAAFRLATEARRHGHAVRLELAGRSLKGQLKQADKTGARYVAIVGDEGVSVKDMQTGEQQTVERASVMHHIRGSL